MSPLASLKAERDALKQKLEDWGGSSNNAEDRRTYSTCCFLEDEIERVGREIKVAEADVQRRWEERKARRRAHADNALGRLLAIELKIAACQSIEPISPKLQDMVRDELMKLEGV